MHHSNSQIAFTKFRSSLIWSYLFSPFHVVLQLIVATLFYSAGELDRIFNLWFLLVPIIGIPTIIVGIVWIGNIFKNLLNRRWSKLSSTIAAPLMVWTLLFLLLRTGLDSHWIRFQFNKSGYQQTVKMLEGTNTAYHSWDWGSTGGAAAANIFYSLIYDESDQVMLEDGKTVNGGETGIRKFGDHFYLVTVIYQ